MPQLFVPILVNDEIGKSRRKSLFSVTGKTLGNSSGSNSDINGYDESLSTFIPVLNKKLKNCFPNESFSFNVYEYGKNPIDGVFEDFTENTMSISLGILCSAYVIKEEHKLKEKYDSITVTGNFNVIDGRISLSEVTDIEEKYKAVQDYASKNADKKHLFVYISSEETIPDGIQKNNVHVIRYDSGFPAECVFAEIFEYIKEDTSTPQKYRNEFIETRAFIKLKKNFIMDRSCNCHIIKGKSNTGKSVATEALCKYLVNSQLISDYVWFYVGENGRLMELLNKEKDELASGGILGKQKQTNYIKEAYSKVFDEFDSWLQTDKRCAIIIDNIEYDIVDELVSFFNRNYPIENNKYVLIITSWEGIRINRIESSIRTFSINNELDDIELKAIVDSVLKVNDYSKKYSEAPETSKNELLELLFRLCRNYPGYIPLVLSALNEYSMAETLKLYKEKDASDLPAVDKILTITFATMDFLSRIVLFAYLQIKKFDDALKSSEIIDILRKNIFNSTSVIDDNDIRRSLNVLEQYTFLKERGVGLYEIKSAVLDFAVFSKNISNELQTARDLIITPERKVEYAIEGKKLDEFKLYIDMISEKETLNKILIKLCKSDSSLEFFKALIVPNRELNLNYICDYGTPLQICAETTTDTRILDFLIAKGADKEARNSVGMSLLHYATENKNSTVLNYILKKRWFRDINEKIDDPLEDGLNPIQLACATSKDAKSIELLRKHGANLDVKSKNGVTLLHYAAENDDCTVLEYLLELKNNPCGNINETDIYGWTPLHWACAYCKNTKSIELLRKYGADFKVRCSDGWNLLHFTVKFYGNSTVLKYLLDNPIGGGINEADNHGVTPLHIACESSKDIKLLLRYGANMEARSNDGWTVLHYAAKNRDSAVLKYILENNLCGNINEPDKACCTPLHLACMYSYDPESIELLWKHGANPKIVTSKGNNILHVAALFDRKEIVEYILKNLPMVSRNQKNLDGKTPADLAMTDGIKKLFEKL